MLGMFSDFIVNKPFCGYGDGGAIGCECDATCSLLGAVFVLVFTGDVVFECACTSSLALAFVGFVANAIALNRAFRSSLRLVVVVVVV